MLRLSFHVFKVAQREAAKMRQKTGLSVGVHFGEQGPSLHVHVPFAEAAIPNSNLPVVRVLDGRMLKRVTRC